MTEAVEVIEAGVQTESRQLATAQQEASALLSIIERVALSPDADITKLERMLAMQKEILAREAEVAFAEDFAAAKAEFPRIVRDRKNTHTNSTYATIDAINEAVDSILAKHGFSCRFKVTQAAQEVTVICIVQHRLGHKEETQITLPLDNAGSAGKVNKTVVQAIGSSTTYARRYAKLAALDISLDDNDGNDGKKGDDKALTEFQAETLKQTLMGCTEKTREWFAETYGSIAQVPRANYTGLLKKLQKAKEAAGANSN